MKRIFVVMAILPFFSCSSAPAPEPEPPAVAETPAPAPEPAVAEPAPAVPAPATGPSQALLDELNAAKAKAEAARVRAGDFESADYFPSEWEAAGTSFTEAGKLPQNDADAQNAIAAFNSAAEAYDSLFGLAVPLYAQAREDEIMALRGDLIAIGARDNFPEYFIPADTTALEAFKQYEAQDYYGAKDTAARALMMYQALTDGCNARLIQQEILDREFEGYDQDNFERAGEILESAVASYDGGDIPAAHENAREALLRYQLALAAGWAGYAELRFSLADTERQAALELKANVAVRDLFAEADSSFKTAKDAFTAKSYEAAANQFINAEAMFVIASASASEKRRIAAERIKQANDKISESDETARQAELALEGGSE